MAQLAEDGMGDFPLSSFLEDRKPKKYPQTEPEGFPVRGDDGPSDSHGKLLTTVLSFVFVFDVVALIPCLCRSRCHQRGGWPKKTRGESPGKEGGTYCRSRSN